MNDPTQRREPPLDPGIDAAYERARALGAKPRDLGDIPGAREQLRREQSWWRDQVPPLAELRDDTLKLGKRDAAIRIYRPKAESRSPVIVYLHGGGWCLGDLDSHINVAAGLALNADAIVIGLAYAKAPEAPFPKPLDEAVAAVRALRGAEGRRLGVDASRVGLAGDSAGANLALAAAISLRDAGTPVQALGLFYGVFDFDLDKASYRQFGDGRFGLSRREMAQFLDYYAPAPTRRDDPRLAPYHADLRDLPPSYLLACGRDVLRDDSLRLAAKLAEAGSAFRLEMLPGATHGFLRFGSAVPLASSALRDAGTYLRGVLVP